MENENENEHWMLAEARERNSGEWVDESGNRVVSSWQHMLSWMKAEREILTEPGWVKMTTQQDFEFYAVWTNDSLKQSFVICEGDISRTFCDSQAQYDLEVKHLREFNNHDPLCGLEGIPCPSCAYQGGEL